MKSRLTILLLASTCLAMPALATTYNDKVLNENETLTLNSGDTANNTTALYKGTVTVKSGGQANTTYVGYTSSNIAGNPDAGYGPITVGSSTMNVEAGGVASNTFVGNSSVMNVSGNANVVSLQWSTGSASSAANAPKIVISDDGEVTNLSVAAAHGVVTMTDNAYASNVLLAGSYASMTMADGTSAEGVNVRGNRASLQVSDGAIIDDLLVSAASAYSESDKSVVNLYGSALSVVVGGQGSIAQYGWGLLNVYDGAEVADLTVSRNGRVNVVGGTDITDTVIDNATINSSGVMTLGSATLNNALLYGTGVLNVNAFGLVEEAVLNDSSTLQVNASGTLGSATINASGTLRVNTSGTLGFATVNDSGTLQVNGYATASDVTVNQGGLVRANMGNATVSSLTLKTGGMFDISTDAVVNITNESDFNQGLRTEEIGGIDHADNWTINDGSTLTVANNGWAENAVVQNGGRIVAKTDTSTVKDMTQDMGGMFDFNTGADVNVVHESALNADKFIGLVGDQRRADDWIVNGGSILTVDAGDFADHATVQGGGMIVAKENVSTVTSSTIEQHGMFHFSTWADITNVNSCVRDPANCQMLEVSGGVADDWNVNLGSTLDIKAEGTGDNDYIFGGTFYVRQGGVSTNMEIVSGLAVIDGISTSNTIKYVAPTSGTSENPSEGDSTTVYIGRYTNSNTGEALALYNDISGGSIYVDSYGTLQSNTISGGIIYVNVDAGSNSNANVNDSVMSGGTVYVYNSANINDTEMSGGAIYVQNGGKANRSDMTGGTIHVYSGGNANTTNMSNGTIYVDRNGSIGIANDPEKGTTMSGGTVTMKGTSYYADVSGGSFEIIRNTIYSNSTAVAYNNTVSGGDFTVGDGGTASTNVITGGTVTVNNHGQLLFSNLSDEANVIINGGGVASDTTMTGGSFTIAGTATSNTISGGEVVVNEDGYFAQNHISGSADVKVNSGAVASDTTMTGGNFTVAGTATDNVVSGGTVVVQNGGVLEHNTLSNASVTVKTTSTMSDTIMTSGNLIVQGTAMDNIISGGTVTVQNGGAMNSNTLSNTSVTLKTASTMNDTDMSSGDFVVEGTATDNIISGGTVTVQNGGAMNSNTLSNASVTVKIASTMSNTIMTSGDLVVEGTATDNIISGGTIMVQNGGVINSSTLSNNVNLTIGAGSTANSTQMSGGLLTVSGTANTTSLSGGKIVATENGAKVNGLTMTNSSVFDFSTNAEVSNANVLGTSPSIDSGHNAKNWTIGNGSILRVEANGTASNTTVNNGGILNNAGSAEDTLVKANGQVNNLADGTLTNLVVNANGKLDAVSGSKIDGDVTIYKNAVLSGDYDYSTIFKSGDLTVSTLNIVDGINTGFNNSLVSAGGDQNTLNLATDEYQISGAGNNGYTKVAGWNRIVIASDSIVDLDGDLTLIGSNSYISLGDGDLLNVKDTTSPNTTITGSVRNSGVINLTKGTAGLSDILNTMSLRSRPHSLSDGDTTDDVLTITGDYTAGSSAFLRMNVNTEDHVADMLKIGGDVSGTTKLILDFLTPGSSSEDIPLVEALNDNVSTAADFTV